MSFFSGHAQCPQSIQPAGRPGREVQMSKILWKRRQLVVLSALGACAIGVGPVTAATAKDVTPVVRPLAEGAEKKEDKGEKIAADKLPAKVVDAVKKGMPGSRITKAFKKTADGKTVYLLDDVKIGKKGWDITVAEDGTILKKEECHDED
jgi:hypothetical protein